MPTVSWKLPPPTHDDSTTSNDNRKAPSLARGESSTPTDWKVHSEFDNDNPFGDDDDDDLTTPANNWKVPPPTLGSSEQTSTDWSVRSEFDDDDDDDDITTTPANNWKVPSSTLGSLKKTPTDWRVRPEFDDDKKDYSTTPANNWKVSPSTLGSSKKTPIDWRVRSRYDDDKKDRSEFDDNDDDSTTPANNWKVPPSTLGSSKKTPTDWGVRSDFDDEKKDYSTTPANNWKVPPSTLASSKKTPTDWGVRSEFDDEKKDYSTTPANNWKVPPSTLGSTNTTQTGWKDRSLLGGNSKNTAPPDNGRLTPIIEDDGSSMTTSGDNPKVPPSVHDNDNNSMKTIPTYTPYLQLPHLLSLAWVTYPVISLIFVAFRLQLSLASAENGLDNVKHGLLASCTAAEKSATAAASLPRYLAETSNQQFVDAANGVMNGAQSALLMSLTILEATINFIIDIFRSTFLCLLELAMGIGLSLVTDAVQAVSTVTATIGSNLANEITSANDAVSKAIDAINKANPFHKIPTPPAPNPSDLSSLQNLSLPSAFQSTLSSLNSSMPTADMIKGAIEDLIDTPFDLLRRAINDTFNNLSFDATLFPVPGENQLTFCHNLDTSSIDNFKKNLSDVAKYGTIIIIGLAVILIGLNCLLIWQQWRSMQTHLERTRQAWESDPTQNPNGSSASAPQVTPGDRNLMMSEAPAPRGNLSDHNLRMSQASASQGNLSDYNLMMPEASVPQGNLSDRNLRMSQASAPQGNLSDHNLMMSHASVPQGNLSDRNLKMPQTTFPSAPQGNLSDRNLTMSQASAPRDNLSDHNLMMPQASVPQGNPSDRNLKMPQAAFPSAPQGNLRDYNLMMPQAPAPQDNLRDHNLMMSQAPAPQGNLTASPSAPQITLSNHNLLMLQADSEHPLITRITNLLAARTGMTPAQHTDMRWFFHYVFHPPALACFLIGFFGLLSIMIQLLLLGPLLKAARAGVDVAVSDLNRIIVKSVNSTMYNQSAAYANDVNSRVDVVQNTINHGLFGWVNGTTTTLNDTINKFYTEVQTFVLHIFNGTLLETPASAFLQCVIGNKVEDVEKALTFLNENLVINIPRVSNDVLVLSPQTVNEATGPIASGAAGDGSNGDQGVLGSAVSLYQASLRSEAVIFGIFLGLWGIVLATAIGVLLCRVHKRKKAMAATKRARVNTEVKVELKRMEENNSSFPNDEKVDPFVD